MSAEDNIAEWAKSNYPGYVLRQYREQDQTAGMLQLEVMMLDPNFWQLDEEVDVALAPTPISPSTVTK